MHSFCTMALVMMYVICRSAQRCEAESRSSLAAPGILQPVAAPLRLPMGMPSRQRQDWAKARSRLSCTCASGPRQNLACQVHSLSASCSCLSTATLLMHCSLTRTSKGHSSTIASPLPPCLLPQGHLSLVVKVVGPVLAIGQVLNAEGAQPLWLPAGLLKGIEGRAEHAAEYAQLLADCQQIYCDTRLLLVVPVVQQHILDSSADPLPTLMRQGCAYLIQVGVSGVGLVRPVQRPAVALCS